MDKGKVIEVTEAMVRAGLQTLLYEYGNRFELSLRLPPYVYLM